jgi:hypothetical protein
MGTIVVLPGLSRSAHYSKERPVTEGRTSSRRAVALCCTMCGDIVLVLSNDLIML